MKQEHKNKISDEEIISQFSITPHIGKIAHTFNIPHITVWRRLKRLGLTPNSRGGKKLNLQEVLSGLHPYYPTIKLKKRLLKEKILENVCSICGITKWNDKPINMQLDHINGISTDHRLENLRMICPNCHSQTETYCGKNKLARSVT